MRGSIQKRGKNTYRVRIFRGRDEQGKQRFHTATIHGSREVAEAYVTKKIHAIQFGGEVPLPRKVRFGELLEQWWAQRSLTLGSNSRDTYEKELRLYVRPFFERLNLADITPAWLQRFYSGKLKEGWSPWVARRSRMHVSSVLDYAVRQRLISFNPAAGKLLELPPVPGRNYVVFGPEQARAFVVALAQHPNRALFLLALETGLRPIEYTALTWKDVNFTKGALVVRRRVIYVRKQGWRFEDDTKTKGSRRQIPLSPLVLSALLEQRERNSTRRANDPKWQEHDLVFPGQHGWPQHARNISRLTFKPLLRAAGLDEQMRIYELRHSMATLLLDAAENIKVVQERLGHTRAAITLDTYSHVLPGRQHSATATLNIILNGQPVVNSSEDEPQALAATDG